MKLQGRVALVTDSGDGISKAIALAMAKQGAKLVVNVSSDGALGVANDVQAMGGEALEVRADVSNSEEVRSMVQRIVKTFDRLDILVNSACTYPSVNLFELEEEQWDRVVARNLKSAFICMKAAAPLMVQQEYGKIINLVFVRGALLGSADGVHCAASAAGVLGLTRSAAVELGPCGVNVNALAIGVVDSPDIQISEDLRARALRSPLRSAGEPSDVASCAVFLASEDAAYMTGQCLAVDGGWSVAGSTFPAAIMR